MEAILVTRCGCEQVISIQTEFGQPPAQVRVRMINGPTLVRNGNDESRLFRYAGFRSLNLLCYEEAMQDADLPTSHIQNLRLRTRKKVWQAPASHPLVKMDAEIRNGS